MENNEENNGKKMCSLYWKFNLTEILTRSDTAPKKEIQSQ